MFLRPRDPDDHRDFERVLPWMTPLFIYQADGQDWVRWSMPKSVAQRMGFNRGCVCCGESDKVEGDVGDVHVDTALSETDWWLTKNGYRCISQHPAEKEGERS
jgi:hypothetical protein